MTTITVQSPRRVPTPRGAMLGAWMFESISNTFARLQSARQARADRLASTARVGDAASVRRYAQSVMQYDARFAADLFAAADRHEQNRN